MRSKVRNLIRRRQTPPEVTPEVTNVEPAESRWGQIGHVLHRWRSTVTLHLDDSEARLMVFRQGRPVQWDSIHIPSGVYADGVVADPEALSGLIDALLQRWAVSRRGVRVTVGGFHAVMRTITMPKLKPKFMPEAIRRQMKREVPVTLEDHHLTWQVIGRTGAADGEVKVLVVAIPQNELESVLKALRLARIQPASVQWKPLAVLRAVNTPNAAVVVLEPGSFDIILSRDGLPLVTRNVAYPPTVRNLSQRIEVASTELGLAVSYVMLEQGEESEVEPASVFLLGQAAETASVREHFEESSGYRLETPQFLTDGAPLWAYAANLGAADMRLANTNVPVADLTPDQWRPTTVNAFEGTAAIALAVGLGVVALPFFHSLQPDPRIQSLQQTIDQTRIEVRVDRSKAEKAAQLAKQVSEAQAQITAYQQGFATLQSEKLRWPEIAASTPTSLQGVNIRSVNEDASNLTLSGSAPTYSDITGYAQFLTDTGWIANVQLTSLTPNQGKGDGPSFDFNLSASRVQTGGTSNAHGAS